jgi:RNA polymerase primary sigma factor
MTSMNSLADGTGRSGKVGVGDVESRNRLVQEHLSLVLPLARQYLNRGLTFEDLVGEGNLGLIRAAEEYDPSFGTRFSTYATYWIREAIVSAVMNTAATIRVPMNVGRLLARWRRTEKQLRRTTDHRPTFDEVATAMGLDGPRLRWIASAHRVSRTLGEEGVAVVESSTFLTIDGRASHERAVEEAEERAHVLRRLDLLEGRERAVVVLRYGLAGEPPMSLTEIGRQLDMTPEMAQKIAMATIWKLGDVRDPDGARGGPAYRTRVG